MTLPKRLRKVYYHAKINGVWHYKHRFDSYRAH